MSPFSLRVILLAGGGSRRMLSRTSKVLHPLGGRPVLAYALEHALTLNPTHVTLVASSVLKEEPLLKQLLTPDIHIAIQEQARGTGDAVRLALETFPFISEADSFFLVLFGDTLLVSQETLQALDASPKFFLRPFTFGHVPSVSFRLWTVATDL